MKKYGLLVVVGMAFAACGGADSGESAGDYSAATETSAEATPEAAEMDAPAGGLADVDWIVTDDAAQTVTINLVAGQTNDNNNWNFNGLWNGSGSVVVPEGYEVTLNFENADPINYHSVVVMEPQASYPAVFESAVPVFEGAETSNATSMTESTEPGGGTETVRFVASAAGDYALVCPVPAHAVTGMWIGFEVSANGESGLRT